MTKRMYVFADKLFNVDLPRVRDFKGINPNSFDGRGNYSLGLKEQLIFPEIEYDKIDKIRGMDIVFVTTAMERRGSTGTAHASRSTVRKRLRGIKQMAKKSMKLKQQKTH